MNIIFTYIFQRIAAETFDQGSAGKFIRLVSDAEGAGDEPPDSSPHIVAELVDK